MEINGHELEMRYVRDITALKRAKLHPSRLDILWTGKCRKRLKNRLKQLDESYKDNMITLEVYNIYKNMINEAI